MNKTDLAVIGSGPGGYISALVAARNGANVVLIEKNILGGTCLNIGCVPTKVLSKTAEYFAHAARLPDLGIKTGTLSLDLATVQERKKQVVETLKSGVTSLLDFRRVQIVTGEAAIEKPGLITIKKDDGKTERLEASKIIIATGSSPASLTGLEFDGNLVLNSADLLELYELPTSLIVVGGGVIGVELASIFSRFGVAVTLVEMLPEMLPFIDEAVVTGLRQELTAAGVNISLATKVVAIEKLQNKVIATLENEQKTWQIKADKILVAAGRVANTSIGEPLGLSENGIIPVNEKMETKLPGIYAVGDVNGRFQLASVAYHEAAVAAENATGGDRSVDYKVVPQSIFTLPEVSGVGLTEADAKKNYDVVTGVFPFSSSAKAMAGGDVTGFVKVVAEKEHQEILGAFILGPSATELIHEFALAIKLEATLEEIADMIHAHPTLSEALFETAHLAMQKPLHFI